MEDSTKIILSAIIRNVASVDSSGGFARNLAADLWQAIEDLPGHPVTTAEVGEFAQMASAIRDAAG